MADILKDNIVKDIQRKIGLDQENFITTEDTSAKEAELITLTVNLVLGVIKVARGYRNSDRMVRKVRLSTTTSTTLVPLLDAYRD